MMNEKSCPLCGSDDLTSDVSEKIMSEPFGGEKIVKIVNYKCNSCGESGDFFNDNEEIINDTLDLLKQESAKNIINDFGLNKISMAAIERALELPQRTLTKWKNGRTKPSATVIALLKFLRLFPWLLEVAENKFDYNIAEEIHIKSAVNRLLKRMPAHGGDLVVDQPTSLQIHITIGGETKGFEGLISTNVGSNLITMTQS